LGRVPLRCLYRLDYQQHGLRIAEAELLFVRAVEILENKGGEPLPNYATALNNLAQLKATNRLAEAEPPPTCRIGTDAG